MKIEVSLGEVVDKLTILDIKRGKITDPVKLENIKKEYDYLSVELASTGFYQDNPYYKELYEVNLSLWNTEDSIRELESLNRFEGYFIALARRVYITNDQRAAIKRRINVEYKSTFIEEKSYIQY